MPRKPWVNPKIHTVLRISVPCQFGNGLHPLTFVADADGSLFGVRCGCDHLPREIEEVASALAEDHHKSCRRVRDVILSKMHDCVLRRNVGFSFEKEIEGLLENRVAVELLRRWVARAMEQRVERNTRNRMPARATGRVDRMLDLFAQHLGSLLPPGVTMHKRRIPLGRDAFLSVELLGVGSKSTHVTYRGKGVWQVENPGDWHCPPTKDDLCGVCGVKHTRAHCNTEKHKRLTSERLHFVLETFNSSVLRRTNDDHTG